MNCEIRIKNDKTFFNDRPCVFVGKPLSYCPEIDEKVEVRIIANGETFHCIINGWKCDLEKEEVKLYCKII